MPECYSCGTAAVSTPLKKANQTHLTPVSLRAARRLLPMQRERRQYSSARRSGLQLSPAGTVPVPAQGRSRPLCGDPTHAPSAGPAARAGQPHTQHGQQAEGAASATAPSPR